MLNYLRYIISLLFICCPLLLHAQTATEPPQFTEAVLVKPIKNKVTTIDLSVGGILNTGNTRSLAVSGGLNILWQRQYNAIAADAKILYAQSALRDSSTNKFANWEATSESYLGKIRYDYLPTNMDSIFTAALGRRDIFAGLDLRLDIQLGYMRNLILQKNRDGKDSNRLWFEIGYDFTFDDLYPNPLIDKKTNLVLKGTQEQHAARLYLGYLTQLNDAVFFKTGAEGLFGLLYFDPIDFRLNWTTEIRVKLIGNIQASLDFTLRYDSEPVPGADPVDTLTTINLIANMDIDKLLGAPAS